MKKKNLLYLVIVAIAFMLISESLFGQVNICRPIEFIELQSMDNDELEAKYCQIMRTVKSRQGLAATSGEAAIQMAELGNMAASRRFEAESNKYSEEWFSCYQESKRVLGIIEKRKKAVTPICP